jgi:hypothetical protein
MDEPCVDVLKNAGASNSEAAAFCAAAFGNADAALAAYELAQDAIDLANNIIESASETADAAIETKNEAIGEVLQMMISHQMTMERIIDAQSKSDEAVERTPSGSRSTGGDVPEILVAVLIESQEKNERELAEIAEEIDSVNKRKQAIREVKQKLEQAEHDYYTRQIERLLSAVVIVGTRAESIATDPSVRVRFPPTPTPSESLTTRSGIVITPPETGGDDDSGPPGQSPGGNVTTRSGIVLTLPETGGDEDPGPSGQSPGGNVTTRSGIVLTLPETGGDEDPGSSGQSSGGNPTTRSGIVIEIDDRAELAPTPTVTATPTRTPTPAGTMPPREPVIPLR